MATPLQEKNLSFVPHRGLRIVWLIIWSSFTFLCCIVPLLLTFVFKITEASEILHLISQVYLAVTTPVAAFVLMWLLFYLKSLKYSISDTHVTIASGIIWRRVREIPFPTITDVVSVQGPVERCFHLGHLNIQTAGRGGEATAEGVLKGLPDLLSKRQEIIGRITRFKNLQELMTKKEEERNSIINLLTGILNELRELRICLGGKK